jgi:aryl-alcohol dehydrogenase-like predicted oxidoreductase
VAGAALAIAPGSVLGKDEATQSKPQEDWAAKPGRVGYRKLGKTGLKISEVGFGGHSWAYKRVPDGKGGYRRVNIDEARAIVSIRVSHKMKGIEADKKEIYKWTESRLKLWKSDYVDLCLLCNTENDTPQSGYWDMSYSIEALDKLRKQGKIRFGGFGCHFTPELFLEAFDKFGDYFDVCSIPYNVRHRAAEKVLPAAKKKGLGVITIKPFARGSLLKKRDLKGADAGLPRDLIAFVLENKLVDICTCGFHTVEQVRENFSASWIPLTHKSRKRLQLASSVKCHGVHGNWLEKDWLYA